jgi:hypothetical protein
LKKDKLENFVNKITGFYSLPHMEKILIIGYYLQTSGELEQFRASDIKECYDALDLPAPANITDFLVKAKGKKKLIAINGGYRVSKLESDRITAIIQTSSNIPNWPLESAIQRVSEMEIEESLLPGLYYIVLIDLVGSTEASSKLTPEENILRTQKFIDSTKDAQKKIKHPERTHFIKDIGDASLFVFSNFKDILEWSKIVDELLVGYNKECSKLGKPAIYHMFSKKCVHLGEVHFEKASNPIAFAINQIFKIEKQFSQNQLGITEVVRHVILPRVESEEITLSKITEVVLAGDKEPSALWIVSYP